MSKNHIENRKMKLRFNDLVKLKVLKIDINSSQ